MLAFFTRLLTLAAQFFIYRAGQTAARAQQQQETITHVETAQKTHAEISRLDDTSVLERLHRNWQR